MSDEAAHRAEDRLEAHLTTCDHCKPVARHNGRPLDRLCPEGRRLAEVWQQSGGYST